MSEICFDEEDHAVLYELEAGSFWFRARNKLLLWAIARHFGERPGHYLELGCGTGFVLAAIEQRYPGLEITGSEAHASGLDLAGRRLQRATLVQLDARALPFTSSFDLVGAYDVLEHIPEDVAVLREVWRSLRPGGLVLLTVPQHPWLWGPSDDHAQHVRRYTRQELRRKLEDAGFELVRLTSFVSVLLPLMGVSRLMRRLRPRAYDPLSEFGLAPWLDRLLEAALGVERAGIRAGLNFPAGGSLLAIARKPSVG